MLPMDSASFVSHKSLGNWSRWVQIFPTGGNSPTVGIASQHLSGQPLAPDIQKLNTPSRTCYSWMLHTWLPGNPLGIGDGGCKSFPPWGIHLGIISHHLSGHPLAPVPPVFDRTLRTYFSWILCTSLDPNP
jgi:hypothetical protein